MYLSSSFFILFFFFFGGGGVSDFVMDTKSVKTYSSDEIFQINSKLISDEILKTCL